MRTALRAVIGGLAAAMLVGGVAVGPGTAATAGTTDSTAQAAATGTAAAPDTQQAWPRCDSYAVYVHRDGRHTTRLPSSSSVLRQFDCMLGPAFAPTPPPSARAVAILQLALNDCYGMGLPVDGVYGPRMQQAVARVQTHHGLRPDGVYAPPTRDVMEWPTARPDGTQFCSVLTAPPNHPAPPHPVSRSGTRRSGGTSRWSAHRPCGRRPPR
jgi:hypothetical protein